VNILKIKGKIVRLISRTVPSITTS